MGRVDFDYVISRRPTFYLFNFAQSLVEIFHRPVFVAQHDDYLAVLTPVYLAYEGSDRKLLVVRRDRPDLDRLADAMHARLVSAHDELHRLGLE